MGKFAALKERPTGPVKTFEESDILRSSNTWEFLIFEQIRAIRFIQHSIFSEPKNSKFHILNLIVALNHLESMLFYKINPSRDETHPSWKEYVRRKPVMFKSIHTSVEEIRGMANSDEFTKLQLVAYAEKWFILLDRYLSGIKRIDAVAYEMKMPDHFSATFEDAPDHDANPDISPLSEDEESEGGANNDIVTI